MAESLEERLENKENDGLEARLSEKSNIFKIGWDLIKYSPFVAAQYALLGPAWTLSTLIPMTGLAIGSIIENRKRGRKTTWNRLKKELYTGNVTGIFDYALFSTPELSVKFIPALASGCLLANIGKTLLFNPLMGMPYNLVYQTFTYFRDHVGLRKTVTGLFTGKIFKYLKECYQNKIKKDFWTDTKNVFAFLFPLHFFQVNYLQSAPARMLQSAVINGPIYRLIMGKLKKRNTYAASPVYNRT